MKTNRSMKVRKQSGYNYSPTPAIILKGNWLKEVGFEIGEYISVRCENGKLIITPDRENLWRSRQPRMGNKRGILWRRFMLVR